jgi:hypothetical protein
MDNDYSDGKMEKMAIEIEKERGSIYFMKMCMSITNEILEKKGIISRDEYKEQFFKTVKTM